MFVRTNNDLPADPSYPSHSFEALGYKLNEQGQIVSIEAPHNFFTYYITDNERTNNVHKEAMHECARKAVREELAKLGVKEVYLSGEEGKDVTVDKPVGKPFTRIMTTDLDTLKTKKDVLIVVGEQTQDLGIWAYRLLTREAGIKGGSAVGLVEKLAKLNFNRQPGPESRTTRWDQKASGESVLAEALSNGTASEPKDSAAGVPGLIILNPGQRLYSPELHEIMTQQTWQARPRSSAIASAHLVDENHNLVPGHKTAEEHIATVFDFVIPRLFGQGVVRMWIVGICDGASNFIDLAETNYAEPADAEVVDPCPKPFLTIKLAGMAFMEPQVHVSRPHSEDLRSMLSLRAVSWVKSDEEKAELLSAPEGYKNERGEEVPVSSMRTFSSKTDVDELIWPAVMDFVLTYFRIGAKKMNGFAKKEELKEGKEVADSTQVE